MLTYFRQVEGRIEQGAELRPEALQQPDTLHWVDLEDPTPEEALVLESVFHFHPLAIEDAVAEVSHPKADDYDDYLFLVLHGISFDAPRGEFVTRPLNAFLGRNYLVTLHRGEMRSVRAAREQCSKGVAASLPRGVDFLLHQMLDQMFERYFPTIDALEDKIQLLQIEVFEHANRETLDRIFALKRDIMHLRRICMPEREIVHRLARGEFKTVSAKAALYFRDVYDNLYRIVESSFGYQDMVQGTLDAYLSTVNNRLNETMKRLTVISAIFAALTVITGVYGMNFRHMPELEWRYGYFLILLFMISVALGLLWLFKRNRWI